MGADVPRGPWYYDGEIDLGFGGALRMAATVVTRDPIFGWVAYGGVVAATNADLSVVPRDGLRQRFDAIVGDAKGPTNDIQRLKIELDRDGFAAGEAIRFDNSLKTISLVLENRTGDRHTTGLLFSAPDGAAYTLKQNGKSATFRPTGDWDYPLRANLDVGTGRVNVELHKRAADQR
jgi:hypothetical protein